MYRQTKQIETYKTTTNKQKSQHNPTKTTQQNNTQPKQTKQTNHKPPLRTVQVALPPGKLRTVDKSAKVWKVTEVKIRIDSISSQ
jgi:hypothetical protein